MRPLTQKDSDTIFKNHLSQKLKLIVDGSEINFTPTIINVVLTGVRDISKPLYKSHYKD